MKKNGKNGHRARSVVRRAEPGYALNIRVAKKDYDDYVQTATFLNCTVSEAVRRAARAGVQVLREAG